MSDSCSQPLAWEALVDYWAGDAAEQSDATEQHLMGCGSCTAAGLRVAAIAHTLRTMPPLTITPAELGDLRQLRALLLGDKTRRPGSDDLKTPMQKSSSKNDFDALDVVWRSTVFGARRCLALDRVWRSTVFGARPCLVLTVFGADRVWC